jgi:hypothetical protein
MQEKSKWRALQEWEDKYNCIVISTLSAYDLDKSIEKTYLASELIAALEEVLENPDVNNLIIRLEEEIIARVKRHLEKPAGLKWGFNTFAPEVRVE